MSDGMSEYSSDRMSDTMLGYVSDTISDGGDPSKVFGCFIFVDMVGCIKFILVLFFHGESIYSFWIYRTMGPNKLLQCFWKIVKSTNIVYK